jgi:hypothetical protein
MQLFNVETEDTDIIVDISNLRIAAKNFEHVVLGILAAAQQGKPYLKGLVRRLEKDGRPEDAEKVNKDYSALLKNAERLFETWQMFLRTCPGFIQG